MSTSCRYPLQTLFELRHRSKKDAQEAYACAQRKVHFESKKLDEMKLLLEKLVAMRKQKEADFSSIAISGECNIHGMQMQNLHIDSLKRKETFSTLEIADQLKTLESAKEIAHAKSNVMFEKAREFEMLEKLKDVWIASRAKEASQKEEELSEEISANNHSTRERYL